MNENEQIVVKTIYIVTSGSYSEYGINAVFDEENLAQKYCDTFNEGRDDYDRLEIEEWDLNPFGDDLSKGRKPYFLRMKKDGLAYDIRKEDSAYGFSESGKKYGFSINNDMYINVFADDEKHAIKIANEHRIQILASNNWGRK